jgi:hypothetical protein
MSWLPRFTDQNDNEKLPMRYQLAGIRSPRARGDPEDSPE